MGGDEFRQFILARIHQTVNGSSAGPGKLSHSAAGAEFHCDPDLAGKSARYLVFVLKRLSTTFVSTIIMHNGLPAAGMY